MLHCVVEDEILENRAPGFEGDSERDIVEYAELR
jgi:hypothetical protein